MNPSATRAASTCIALVLVGLTLPLAVNPSEHRAGVLKDQSSECTQAEDTVDSARNAIQDRIEKYWECVRASRGDDSCRFEFRRLRRAQGDFEDSVAEVQAHCT
jgi:hypothetical protein